MLFAHLFVSLGSAMVASSLTLTGSIPPGFDSDGHFGAQTPPWAKGCHPGWYYGENPSSYPDVFCLTPDTCHKIHSKSLGFHCPPNPYPSSEDGYYQTFSNLKAATEASDYLTYGLVESVEACLAMCDCVEGCSFVNSYVISPST
ncbi:hypothetical protein F5887DRAFT_957970 [Amanita rubescens]|nr:hypothetical protein F5887DRAFT_957970 [Amanita rubescens]